MTSTPLFESSIPELDLILRGKVRDMYAVDEEHILIVTTDRISAYDVILPDPVAGKGEVLTQISNFWFAMMEDLVPNHLSGKSLASVIGDPVLLARSVADRSCGPRLFDWFRLARLPGDWRDLWPQVAWRSAASLEVDRTIVYASNQSGRRGS